MAKGIRSKTKRANRTLIRKTVSGPIIRKRQEEMSKALQKQIASRKLSSISKLKQLLPVEETELKNAKGNDEDDEDDEDEQDVGHTSIKSQ
mmetsp:Transcript_25655/g.43022  ORF Transcript_25655/g.43022 Transcript_25655/m.43022 type:complete len:91 (+) Transcript_25655:544-816(+)